MVVSVGDTEERKESHKKHRRETRLPFLDTKVVSYRYDKYKKGEQETDLGHVGEELFEVIEIQVGARELGLDDIPDPLEESCVGDIG